jgi:hypothetical protein
MRNYATSVVHWPRAPPTQRKTFAVTDQNDESSYPPTVAWIADAQSCDGKRFIVRAEEKLTAFVELEREVLTTTFYLASIHGDSCNFEQ